MVNTKPIYLPHQPERKANIRNFLPPIYPCLASLLCHAGYCTSTLHGTATNSMKEQIPQAFVPCVNMFVLALSWPLTRRYLKTYPAYLRVLHTQRIRISFTLPLQSQRQTIWPRWLQKHNIDKAFIEGLQIIPLCILDVNTRRFWYSISFAYRTHVSPRPNCNNSG